MENDEKERTVMKEAEMDTDAGVSPEIVLFKATGSFGRWQKIVFAIFFYVNMIGTWQNLAITFQAPNVPFRCVELANATVLPGECYVEVQRGLNLSEISACRQWEYNSSYNTLVQEWDLVCDREWLISFSKSIYMMGFMTSVFVFGHVSDCVGRYNALVISYIITLVAIFLSLISSSMVVFLILRYMIAFGRTGFSTTGIVLLMEIVSLKHRSDVSINIQFAWSLGFASLALIGYVFRDWFWYHLVITLPLVPVAFAFRFIPESPRWLRVHRKLHSLKRVILEACRMNKREFTDEDIDILVKRLTNNNECEKRGTVLDLFRTPRMRGRTFIAMYLWFVNALIYYGISYNTNDLSGDPYLNFFLAGALEFPSYIMLIISIRKFGRRLTLVVLMMAIAISYIAQVPGSLPWLNTGFALFGKFCVTASFGLMYLYTGELYPTVVRCVALGSCSAVGRMGPILAPFARELGKASHPFVPNVIFCVLSVSSGLFAILLPETAGRKLPDSLEDGEKILEMK